MELPPLPPAKVPVVSGRGRFSARCLLLLSALFLLAVVVVAVSCPEQLSWLVRDISPGCTFRRITGIACPGCGGTRAARALLHGDIMGAVQHNLLLPIGIAAFLAEYVRLFLVHFTRLPDWAEHRSHTRLFVAYSWIVLGWFVLRNLFGI